MTYKELLAKISFYDPYYCEELINALRAVIELHKPNKNNRCGVCTQVVVNAVPNVHTDTVQHLYPCPTIQAIEKKLG